MRRLVALLTVMAVFAGALVTAPRAEVTVKFSGDILYRWMLDYKTFQSAAGEELGSTGDFQNRYWWNFRMAIAVNENLSFNLRLSNPRGYFTDLLGSNLGLVGAGAPYNYVSIPELYFKWTYSIVTLLGGFIPVAPPGPNMYNSTLDLVAFETAGFGPGKYVNAGIMPWFVATNGSQTGLDLILQFVKNDNFAVGLDVIGTVATDSGASITADQIKKDQFRLIFGLPTSLAAGKIGLLPSCHIRTNVVRSDSLDKGNASMAGGLDLVVKPLKDPAKLQGRLGFAAGGYKNDSRKDDPGYVETAPLGMVLNAAVKVMPGYGTASVDFAWGNWRDRGLDDVIVYNMAYWDIIFDAPVKSLVFRPRLRMWYYTNRDNDATTFHARPELDFIAKF